MSYCAVFSGGELKSILSSIEKFMPFAVKLFFINSDLIMVWQSTPFEKVGRCE